MSKVELSKGTCRICNVSVIGSTGDMVSGKGRVVILEKEGAVMHRSFGCANPRVSRGNPICKSGSHSKEKITSNGTGR